MPFTSVAVIILYHSSVCLAAFFFTMQIYFKSLASSLAVYFQLSIRLIRCLAWICLDLIVEKLHDVKFHENKTIQNCLYKNLEFKTW